MLGCYESSWLAAHRYVWRPLTSAAPGTSCLLSWGFLHGCREPLSHPIACKPGLRGSSGYGIQVTNTRGSRSQADTFGVLSRSHHNQHNTPWASFLSFLVCLINPPVLGSCPQTNCPTQALVPGPASRGNLSKVTGPCEHGLNMPTSWTRPIFSLLSERVNTDRNAYPGSRRGVEGSALPLPGVDAGMTHNLQLLS